MEAEANPIEQEGEALGAVSDILSRVERKGRFVQLQLRNGIKITCKPLPPLFLDALNAKFRHPPPPKQTIHREGKPDFEEENPNDPAWIRLCADLDSQYNIAVVNLYIGAATELVRPLPEGYIPPEDDKWLDEVKGLAELTGQPIEIDTSSDRMRYVSWMRLYALDNDVDVMLVSSIPHNLSGVTEVDVLEAVRAFRSLPKQTTDRDGATSSPGQNGHRTNRATRRARRPS